LLGNTFDATTERIAQIAACCGASNIPARSTRCAAMVYVYVFLQMHCPVRDMNARKKGTGTRG